MYNMANQVNSSPSPPNEEENLESQIASGQPLQEEPEIVATLEELKIAQDFILKISGMHRSIMMVSIWKFLRI